MHRVAAVNDQYFAVSALEQEAQGYQWPKGVIEKAEDLKAPGGFVFVRTGGLVIKRRVLLQEDMLYRFAARRYLGQGVDALVPLLNSPWWMNDDRMVLLLSRARSAGVPLVEMARRQLALPLAWTECDILVRARTKPRLVLAAHAGPGRTAQVKTQDGVVTESYTIATEAPHLFMDQLYVPGLGRHFALGGAGETNARAWFDLSTTAAFDPRARGLNP